MIKIKLDLSRNANNERSGIQLDVAHIMSRLLRFYPSIEFEDEYFLGQVKRIEKLKEPEDKGNALKIALKDAEERGPGYKFTVVFSNGSNLKGTVTRYSLSFSFEEGIPAGEREKAEVYINSFNVSVSFDEIE